MKRAVSFSVFVCAFVIVLAAPMASADATVTRHITFGGFYGQGAFKSDETVSYRGVDKRVEQTREFTGSFLSKVTGKGGSVTITRVKKDQIIELDTKKKTYTIAKITPEAAKKAEGRGDEGGEKSGSKEKSRVKVIKNEVKVKETGEKKKINGFSCNRYIVTWELITEDLDTGERSESLMTNDLWNTPRTKAINALEAEEKAFMKAYFKKLGMDLSTADAQKFGLAMIAGATGSNAKAFTKKMGKIKGYSIVVKTKWEQATVKGKAKGGGGGAKEKEGGLFGGVTSIGDALGKAAAGAIEKRNEGKKKVIFESSSEVKAISTKGLGKGRFDIPKGYKEGKKLF